MEQSGRKNIPLPYSDLFLFLHGLCKLASRVQKETSFLTEDVETFQIQQYSDKDWSTTFMRGFTCHSTFFYCLYLIVSQIVSDNFFRRHRTGMRRSHLQGLWLQGVVMLYLVLIVLGQSTEKAVLPQKRTLWGKVAQLMQHNAGGCSLEGEVPPQPWKLFRSW